MIINKKIKSITHNVTSTRSFDFLTNSDFDYTNKILDVVKLINKKITYTENDIASNLFKDIDEIAKFCYCTKKNNSQINVYTSLVNEEDEINLKPLDLYNFIKCFINDIKDISVTSDDSEEKIQDDYEDSEIYFDFLDDYIGDSELDDDEDEYYEEIFDEGFSSRPSKKISLVDDDYDYDDDEADADFRQVGFDFDQIYTNSLMYNSNGEINDLDDYCVSGTEKYKFLLIFKNKDVYANVNEYYLKILMCEIISNACKFSKNSKTVTIILDKNQKNAVISVFNSGSGLHESISNDAFRPFVKYYDRGFSSSLKGCGLGLSIANKIIEIFGGRISFGNDKFNTIVTISFPIDNELYGKNLLNEFTKPQREFSDVPYDKLAFCHIFGNYSL